jgi:hypothetical protein
MDKRPTLREILTDKFHKHKKWEPLIFFVSGFSFDALLLHRIDDPLMLTHQAIYLTIAALIIAWDLFIESEKGSVPRWLNKIWFYREGLLHFILGTLLNVYTIFYFKSGTLLSSIVFLGILASLLYLNEVRPKQISKHVLRNALFSLCVFSYMNIVVSIVLGAIGTLIFLAALLATTLVLLFYVLFLKSRLDPRLVTREILFPFVAVIFVYTSLYFLKVLPPVPLSIKSIGIYHEITKVDDTYRLGYNRPRWRFWESGDQHFEARPGDQIYCFVQVFSPARFKEKLFVRWQFHDPRAGWTNSDAIELKVVGGRAEGYRGFTVKNNYQPGRWRVSIETSDGREIGRIGLEVLSVVESGELPPLTYELK